MDYRKKVFIEELRNLTADEFQNFNCPRSAGNDPAFSKIQRPSGFSGTFSKSGFCDFNKRESAFAGNPECGTGPGIVRADFPENGC